MPKSAPQQRVDPRTGQGSCWRKLGSTESHRRKDGLDLTYSQSCHFKGNYLYLNIETYQKGKRTKTRDSGPSADTDAGLIHTYCFRWDHIHSIGWRATSSLTLWSQPEVSNLTVLQELWAEQRDRGRGWRVGVWVQTEGWWRWKTRQQRRRGKDWERNFSSRQDWT